MTRDNGLEAVSYTPLTALASSSADAVLEVLRQAGVAAYVVTAGRGTVNRLVLWVDSGATARARDVLDRREPTRSHRHDSRGSTDGPGEPDAANHTRADVSGEVPPAEQVDEDAAWRAIVAAFDTPPTDAVVRWPEAENLADVPSDDSGNVPGESRVLRRINPRTPRDEPPDNEGGGGDVSQSGGPAAELDGARAGEDHYVPPPPPPLPRPDPVTRWAWLGLLGGPLFLFVTALLGQQLADWLVLAALGAFVVGFVTLVVRMKDRPPSDSGGDDGAVV